jgi:NAD(P)-dependent dehydrogenase (short-subunit alcohol dehydrogenase family)
MIVLKNKTALITGSTRGIGQQIAKGLAEHGCNVIVHGRKIEHTKSTIDLLKAYDVRTFGVFGDLSNDDDITKLIEQVKALNISVDILYNNAGIMLDWHEDIWSHPTEDWLKTFQVNVIAMYRLCSAFIPDMIKNGFGRVVNTTSRIADQPQLAPYGASKWAVDKLSMDLAHALKDTPVRLNYFDPGWLQTDLGGEFAPNSVESVLPDALKPILIDDDGPNGEFFQAN